MNAKLNRQQAFRERILGNDPLPVSPAASWAWVEVANATPAPTPPPAIAVAEVSDAGEGRYFQEDFVRGKIENWAGRPAGGQGHPLVVSETMAARMELRRGSTIPIDHTDADITARTFVAMDERMAAVLQWYHTSGLSLADIAKEVSVSYTECRRLVTQGHVTFVDEWTRQAHRLRDELRRLAPALDPSRDATPAIALPRPDPWGKPPKTPAGKPRQC